MGHEDYVREKLSQAVEALATGDQHLRERLGWAAQYLLCLEPSYFVNKGGRARYTAIREMLVRREATGSEGHIQETLNALSDDEVRRIAKAIFELDSYYRPLWFFVGKTILDES